MHGAYQPNCGPTLPIPTVAYPGRGEQRKGGYPWQIRKEMIFGLNIQNCNFQSYYKKLFQAPGSPYQLCPNLRIPIMLLPTCRLLIKFLAMPFPQPIVLGDYTSPLWLKVFCRNCCLRSTYARMMFSGVICGDENFSTSTSNVWGIIMHVLCCVKRGGYRMLEIETYCVPPISCNREPISKARVLCRNCGIFFCWLFSPQKMKGTWNEKFEWIYDHLNSIKLRCGCDSVKCLTALLLLQFYSTLAQGRLTPTRAPRLDPPLVWQDFLFDSLQFCRLTFS